MLRSYMRSTFRTPLYLAFLIIMLVLMLWMDSLGLELYTLKAVQRLGVGEVNTAFHTNYASVEELQAEFPQFQYDMAFERISQKAPIGILLAGFMLIPMLIGRRKDDRSLQVASQTGNSRVRQALFLMLWIYVVAFCLTAAELIAFFYNVYLHPQIIPSIGIFLRLLLLRGLYTAAWFALPAFLSVLLDNIFLSILFSAGVTIGLYYLSPYSLLSNSALWDDSMAVGPMLLLVAVCLVWTALFTALSCIFYRKADIKH